MPVDPENTTPAPKKRRARKIGGEAAAKSPRKPRVAKKSLPAPAAASKPAERLPVTPAAEGKPMTVIINGVPTPILPVTPREPATAEARSQSRPAAPVPVDTWRWVRSPLAATIGFLGALSVLMAGYWTGYNVATGAMDQTAVTIVEASEIPQPVSSEPAQASFVNEEPEKIEMDARDLGEQAQTGLHLQVSALKSPSAASKLQKRLESHGFPVRVDPASNDSLVRVYVGPIEDKTELQTLTSALKKEGLEPFPKRL